MMGLKKMFINRMTYQSEQTVNKDNYFLGLYHLIHTTLDEMVPSISNGKLTTRK